LWYTLFRGITRGVLPYLSPVPRDDTHPYRTPDCAPLQFRLSGVIKISPLRGEARKPSLSEIRRDPEAARRLAIFAVKKLKRFEREETRTVRSCTERSESAASFHVREKMANFREITFFGARHPRHQDNFWLYLFLCQLQGCKKKSCQSQD